jgi:hypothetical protein
MDGLIKLLLTRGDRVVFLGRFDRFSYVRGPGTKVHFCPQPQNFTWHFLSQSLTPRSCCNRIRYGEMVDGMETWGRSRLRIATR